jgi:hypothetical protein
VRYYFLGALCCAHDMHTITGLRCDMSLLQPGIASAAFPKACCSAAIVQGTGKDLSSQICCCCAVTSAARWGPCRCLHAAGSFARQLLRFVLCADGHVTAVVAVAFLEGGASSERCAALSADSRGRLLFHAVSSYLSLTAMLAGARAGMHTCSCYDPASGTCVHEEAGDLRACKLLDIDWQTYIIGSGAPMKIDAELALFGACGVEQPQAWQCS